jgi:hypothetical protein
MMCARAADSLPAASILFPMGTASGAVMLPRSSAARTHHRQNAPVLCLVLSGNSRLSKAFRGTGIRGMLSVAPAGETGRRVMQEQIVLIGAGSAVFTRGLIADGAADSLDTAEHLADDLPAAHAEHLPQFRRDDMPST